MTRHVILAYGKETELWRATFAVLSFYAWLDGDRADAQTVVFTDRPEFFAPFFEELPVSYSLLTPARLAEMRGPDQYIHRVKLAVVAQAFEDYPGENVLFCDSDTFFVSDAAPLLRRLRADVSFLHLREFTFADAVGIYAGFTPANQDEYPRRFISLIESRTFRVGSEEQQFHKTQFMWNSGVLGLHHEVAGLMPEICALNDAFYQGTAWLTSEQIAFSLALPVKTQLLPSDQYVFHYWGRQQKQLMDELLHHLSSSQFRALALPKRLATAKDLTASWRRKVQGHLAREGALYSLANGQVKAGVKCAVKALIAEPFDVAFAKDLVTAFRKGRSS